MPTDYSKSPNTLERRATMIEQTELLTPTQAARLLGVSKTRVIQLGEAGRLSFVRTLLGRVFDAESVNALVRERRASHAPPVKDSSS